MPASIEETTFAITDPGYTSGNLYQNAFHGVAGFVSGTQTYTNSLVFHLDAGLSNELKTFTRDALSRLDAILQLDFQETSNASDPAINFLYRIEDFPGSTLGAAETTVSTTTGPGGTSYELDVTIGFELSAGVALNAYPSISDATAQTILHEMGHSLGLSHPYGDGWTSGFTTQNTLMSYYWTSTGPETPFLREADVRALVGLWGSERPITAADWFVQGASSGGGGATASAPGAGGGGGGAVIISRETPAGRSRSRGATAAGSRPSRNSNTSRGGIGGRPSSEGNRRGRVLTGRSRRSFGSSRVVTNREERLMMADPITNPGQNLHRGSADTNQYSARALSNTALHLSEDWPREWPQLQIGDYLTVADTNWL